MAAMCQWLHAILPTFVQGSFASLWQSYLGIGPVFSLLQSAAAGGVYAGHIVSAATSTTLFGLLYGIKTLVMPPPKKLKWWETDEFAVALTLFVLLAMLLLVVLGLTRCMQSLARKLRRWSRKMSSPATLERIP